MKLSKVFSLDYNTRLLPPYCKFEALLPCLRQTSAVKTWLQLATKRRFSPAAEKLRQLLYLIYDFFLA